MILSYSYLGSPVGKLKLVASNLGLVAVLWEYDNPNRVRLGSLEQNDDHMILRQAKAELEDYFAAKRFSFSVPLDAQGTPFQKEVWQALLDIPFGETRSYGQIAHQVGQPAASRAVGAANGRNPISIITPCHRVIGASGKLTGFAGGLEAKAYLPGTTDVKHLSRSATTRRRSRCIGFPERDKGDRFRAAHPDGSRETWSLAIPRTCPCAALARRPSGPSARN